MEIRRRAENVEKGKAASVPGMDSAKDKRGAEEPFTQSDFVDALKKASRKIEPGKRG